jgi:ABC-type spermidine/putrescine transport system permease subunit II
MLVPSVVHGVSMVLYWRLLDFNLTVFGSAFVGHVTYVLPFAFLTIFPRVHHFDESLEEAARDLGATDWTVFRRVVLPLILPGLVSGALLAFIMSFDEFIRALLLTSNEQTLPMYLWAVVTNDLSPQPNATSAMMVAFTIAIFAIWIGIQGRAARASRSPERQSIHSAVAAQQVTNSVAGVTAPSVRAGN